MNILHIGNFTRGWDNSICDELHISEALQELGHTVTNIQREQWRDRLADDEQGKWHPHPRFILLAQWDGFSEDFIAHIRDLYFTTPIVYWCYDYQNDGQEWHERLVEQSDLYLSKRIADSKYPNWQWLSQDFAPAFLDKHPFDVEKDIDILFTGSYLPWADERNKTISSVNAIYGHKLVVHSINDWPFLDNRPPIMDELLPELYARAKIVLAIDHTIEAGYWSDRAAQVMCCGAFVLHRYVPLMESRFHNNVAYFKSIGDCMGQLSYYLEQKEVREMIADKGYRYARENLKVTNRVQDLLTIVESIL